MNNILKFSEDGKSILGVNDISITSITIPDNVTTIGDSAFRLCSALQSINIPDSVTTIGENAFSGCKALKSIDIPNSVTTIENYAFEGCSALQSIDIPNSVTTIGIRAFEGCSALQSIDIPNSVTTINSCIFCDCNSLKSISFHKNNLNYTFKKNAIYSKDLSIFIKYINNSTVNSYILPNEVLIIKEGAFCKSTLQNIGISNNLTTIENRAFNGCSALKSIEIPNSVTTIGYHAFLGCTTLQSIHLHWTQLGNIQIDNYALSVNFEECTLYVPPGTRWEYRHHPVFGKFKNIEIEKQE